MRRDVHAVTPRVLHVDGETEGLRAPATRLLLLGLVVLAAIPLWYIAAFPGSAGLLPLVIALALMLTWCASRLALRRGIRTAGLTLVLCLFTVVVLVWRLHPGVFAPLGFSAVVVVATVLVGPRFGLVTASAASLAIWIEQMSSGTLTGDGPVAVFLSTWIALVLAWMLWQPVETAVGWAWQNYLHAVEIAEQLRDHQGELARLNRSLGESYERLEQLARALDAARRSADEARQLKTAFATTVSHELRTPLNLIIGFSEMIVMKSPAAYRSLPATVRGDVEAIYRNASHLSNLVDDILDLSQLDAHRMGISREEVELRRIVEEAVRAVDAMFGDKGLWLRCEIREDLPTLSADRTRVRQVMINLLSNAARFTATGGVTIRAAAEERQVVVSVADTGIGIAPEDLPGVFDEFRQVGMHGPGRHSGLGLAICRRFVEMHGGNIWVESRPGEGATFSFALPLAQSVVSSPPERDWELLSRRLTREALPPTIAVLDDDPVIGRVLQRYLDDYRVVVVAPDRVGELLATEPIQALVATGDQADGSTLDAAGASDLPVIRCALRARVDAAVALEVAGYLRKPINHEQIAAALRGLGRAPRVVLVADDDEGMVRLLGKMVRLAFPRCRVVTARDGREALVRLRGEPPDALLLDLAMPVVDGRRVLEEMRSDPALREIPVVVITATGAGHELLSADAVVISRPGGLSVGEAMRCLSASLAVLVPGRGPTGGER